MSQTDLEDPEHLGRAQQPRDKGAVRVQNKAFAIALARAVNISARTDTIPALASVLLRVADGVMTIEATNMEQALRQGIPASGSPVTACVNAARLNAIIQKLPSDQETILEFKGDSMSLRCGVTRATLATVPVDEFPAFHESAFAASFTIEAEILGGMLDRVRAVMSTEQTRFYLCGVSLSMVERDGIWLLRAAATNGNDLAIVTIKAPDGSEKMPNVIVPAPAINELVRLLKDADTVEVGVSDTRMAIRATGIVLITKLIDGTYPEIDRVIPRSNPHKLTVDGAALSRAAELATLASDGGKPWVRLTLSKDAVSLSGGEGANTIVSMLPDGCFEYEGDDMALAFLTFSLVEPARNVKRRLVFWFGEAAPFLAQDEDDDSASYVGMGIRR